MSLLKSIGLTGGRAQALIRAAAALVLGAHLAIGNAKADDVVFGYYDEFTLYFEDEGGLKDEILLVFHGFGSAMPNGAYRSLHNKYAERYSIIGFNYDYFDLTANDTIMDAVWDQILKDKSVTFAGTSLGGFWANYYAEKFGVPKVFAVNPVIDPVQQLRQFVGTITVEKRNKTVLVTETDIDNYIGRKARPSPDIERLIILTRDDKILDYRLAEDWYDVSGTELVILDDGGHTLNLREERYEPIIKPFLLGED
ncbi:putative esterase YcpF (UPF0227 family) [Shimia isoporae]|uniref:Putative esterase YcpF (UPF0227 family) n=2 Tax=Shimia isoporae TaxID=647720 RepID=A0A4R1N040_9RHOB|nr:putative esterase YcpF (UPF0227 family) [Shimia isoporae]